MNQEIKQKWLEALRSGNYKQAPFRLRTEEGFCCLGVLCDIVDPSKWEYKPLFAGMPDVFYYGERRAALTEDMKSQCGLTTDQSAALADMNDFKNKNFNQIADFIEENL